MLESVFEKNKAFSYLTLLLLLNPGSDLRKDRNRNSAHLHRICTNHMYLVWDYRQWSFDDDNFAWHNSMRVLEGRVWRQQVWSIVSRPKYLERLTKKKFFDDLCSIDQNEGPYCSRISFGPSEQCKGFGNSKSYNDLEKIINCTEKIWP